MSVKSALIVDDSKSARVMLGRLLSQIDIQYNFVESGEEALEFLGHESAPDLIFMDHMMPGMDGLEATRVISQNPTYAKIPIIMYTSQDAKDYHSRAISNGAAGVIVKPARLPRLTALLSEIEETRAKRISDSDSPLQGIQEIPTQTVLVDQPGITKETLNALLSEWMNDNLEKFVESRLSTLLPPWLQNFKDEFASEIRVFVQAVLEEEVQVIQSEASQLRDLVLSVSNKDQTESDAIKEDLTGLRVQVGGLTAVVGNATDNLSSAVKKEVDLALNDTQLGVDQEIDRRLRPLINAVDKHHRLLDSETAEACVWRDELLKALSPAISNVIKTQKLDAMEQETELLKRRLGQLEKEKQKSQVFSMICLVSVVLLAVMVGYVGFEF